MSVLPDYSKKEISMKNKCYRVAIILTGIWVYCISLMPYCQAVQPEQKYGILGKKAPALTSNYWVDKNSNPVKEVLLSDHKGKVIYMLFFQDW